MKRLPLILAALAAIALLAAAAGLRRVPAGFEAVRVAHDGFEPVASGWHFVGPGSHLVRYPVGVRDYRVPREGSSDLIFQDGMAWPAAFHLRLDIASGSAGPLFEKFSEDFEAGLDRLVVAAAEIEAASRPEPGPPDALAAAMATRVREELAPLGVSLASLSVARWGDEDLDAGESARGHAPRRLVIVGVDGGDWMNLQPLIDAGKLPNFARLVHDGATGPLRSEEPMLSPLLWTTMATGRYPEDHGILNFTVVDPKSGARVPISRLYRRVDAFWNMLGDYGRRVAVIGWLATDPAEPVDGLMVTDKFGYLAYAPDDTARAPAGSVYPSARRDDLSRLVVHGDAVPAAEILRFVAIPPAEIAEHRGDFDPKDPINNLIHLYASTLSFRNIALHEIESGTPDVLAVYFEWVDAMSHLFMLHTPPRMPDVPSAEYDRFHGAVEQAYVLQDEILGQILDAVDDRTIVAVVSDHGFKSGAERLHNRPEIWAGNAAKWHRLNGIVGFYGPGVRAGTTLADASILDIAPTVLALLGLPRAADMPGKPLAAAFDDSLTATFDATTVATLDRPRQSGGDEQGGASEETMKKLEALGYLTPDNADAKNNLGQRYQQRGEFEKAIEAYQAAIAMRPNFYAAFNNLAVCYGHLEMYAEAEDALRKCIALKPDDFYAMNNLAVMYMRTGRVDEGTKFAEQAVKTEPGYANGRVTLGSIYAMQRRYADAEAQFQEALRLDPSSDAARVNLEKVRKAKGGQ
ncbi:MAG TPA: alkaline phosphatase family protein [Candidatus Krumholzibacteria bacterium]|nr:alkaline phosphatase family protein [Candidatus Krumholzibacteria bacterium]